MPDRILKYILDIEAIIEEIELLKKSVANDFNKFKDDFKSTRAVERQLEIIGEAANKINQLDPTIEITGIKSIISLRNFIVHAYDSVDHEILWGIIQKDIPVLKNDIQNMKK
ncbi:MAG: DUF86 domain-containing protein [Bacteroidetes bacterium]|nr:DUF86 domain-containing protein [Bacteroidota bacterium]